MNYICYELQKAGVNIHRQEFKYSNQTGCNVVAVVESDDEEFKNEYILIGAHYDHLGIKTNKQGKTVIYNGADDNASGTAILMQLARRMQKDRHLLKRSIILVAFDAEEEGLIGSRYFSENPMPISDIHQIKLMINLDMVGWLKGDALKISGTGTQKIEQYVQELFPENKVERIDSDVLVRKGEHIRLLERFQKGDIDILVGTQMIAKGLDNPNVTLVGVISADASFNLPDFRSSERGFQLLTQVAGRAGRGEFTGRVFFQTYNPEFYALESAKSQNYREFYEKEIIAREEFDYPPYSKIVRLIISSMNNFRAEKAAAEIALSLCTIIEKYGVSERLEVLGPTPCVIERINSYYRFQIIIKNKLDVKGHQFISSFLNKVIMPKDVKLAVDVDPLDIL